MDIKQLRSLVRQEVEKTIDEELRIDSHPKFRRLVEHQVGQKLDEFSYDITFQAWQDALQESGDNNIPSDVLEYYVTDAVRQIKASLG